MSVEMERLRAVAEGAWLHGLEFVAPDDLRV
jgi:hypothetical protein